MLSGIKGVGAESKEWGLLISFIYPARGIDVPSNALRTALSGNGRIAPIAIATLLLQTLPESSGDILGGNVSSFGPRSLASFISR